MGLFGDEALRLLRERWPDANELAEEIFAILTSTKPLEFNGPIVINNPGNSAPITINNDGGTHSVIEINRRDPGTPQIPEIPPLPPNSPGIYNFTIYYDDSPPERFDTPPDKEQDKKGEGTQLVGGGGGVPGKVLSGGPGAGPYTVTLYPTGLGGASQGAQAQVLQIADDATVPAGTWSFFTKGSSTQLGTLYYFQVPVWLEGSSS